MSSEGNSKFKDNKRIFLSLILTALIAGTLIFIPQSLAVNVKVTDLDGVTISKGQTHTFYIDVDILSNERIYPTQVKIELTGPTSLTRTFTAAEIPGTKAPITLSQHATYVGGIYYGPGFGYGYSYGPLYGYGYGYHPPVGYGYGYYNPGISGYGYSGQPFGATLTLRYRVDLDTSTIASGSYTLTASVKVNGSTFISSPVNFTVTGPFTLTADPAAVTLQQGGTAQTEITITSIAGFSAPVTLTIVGALPTGVTAEFGDTTVTPPPDGTVSSTLFFTATPTAAIELASVTVRGTSGGITSQTTIILTITAAPEVGAPGPAPAPPAPPAPPASEINTDPEGAAPSLIEAAPSDAASSLLEADTDAAAAAIVTMADLDLEASADVLVEMAAADASATAAVLETIVETDPSTAAELVEAMFTASPTFTATALNNMSSSSLASLILAIFGLPETPSTAAQILGRLMLTKQVEAVDILIGQDKVEEVALIFSFLSTTKLNNLFDALTAETRLLLVDYLSAETIARISPELIPGVPSAVKTETVTIGAGETLTIDHKAETGIVVEITALTTVTGDVTTKTYGITPKPEALKPNYIEMPKFVEVTTTIPSDQITQIKVTIYYTDAEMYLMIESTLKIYKYNEITNQWDIQPTVLDKINNNVSTTLKELSFLSVGGVDP